MIFFWSKVSSDGDGQFSFGTPVFVGMPRIRGSTYLRVTTTCSLIFAGEVGGGGQGAGIPAKFRNSHRDTSPKKKQKNKQMTETRRERPKSREVSVR